MAKRPPRQKSELVIITGMSGSGKGSVIRASFPQAGPWTRSAIAHSDYVMWSSDLRIAR